MEKQRRQSRKQKEILEVERQKKVFEKQYEELKTSWNYEILGDGLSDKESFVEKKLKQYKSKPCFPSGKYQEPDEAKITHQQKFMQAIRDTSPHLIEEIRPLVENFKALFIDSCKIRMRSDVRVGTALFGIRENAKAV